MGNHEYCTECGESDFHNGQECDPATKAKHQARLRAGERREAEARGTAKQLAKHLEEQGVKCSFDFYGNVVISKWDIELCECGQPENSIRHSSASANSIDAHAFKPKVNEG